MMKQMEKFIDKVFGPIALYMSKSPFFQALTDAFMRMTPLTLGASVLMIIGFFPVPAWTTWLNTIGLTEDFIAVQNASINALGLMLAFTFAYSYVKINAKAYDPLISGLLSLASFLMLMPQKFMLYTLADPIVEFPAEGSITSGTELSAFSTKILSLNYHPVCRQTYRNH